MTVIERYAEPLPGGRAQLVEECFDGSTTLYRVLRGSPAPAETVRRHEDVDHDRRGRDPQEAREMTEPIYPQREVAAILAYYGGFASEAEAINAIEDYTREHGGGEARVEGYSAVGHDVTVVVAGEQEVVMPPRIATLMYELAEQGGVPVEALVKALHEELRLDARPRSAEGS